MIYKNFTKKNSPIYCMENKINILRYYNLSKDLQELYKEEFTNLLHGE